MSVIGKHLFTLKVYIAAAAAVAAATFFRSTVKCLLQIKPTLPTFPSLIHRSPRPPTPLLVGVCIPPPPPPPPTYSHQAAHVAVVVNKKLISMSNVGGYFARYACTNVLYPICSY